jgi:uncharacterized protein with ParB-like and HNH nuclease domain
MVNMPELSVNRKSIGKLFDEMQNKKFIIPDFQRPYSWDIEKCETLWQDITNFLETEESTSSDYFLGTIVSNKNDNGNQEIIDGQQRITTLLLILRVFYNKLEQMPENNEVRNLKSKLAPCIWDVDEISGQINDKKRIRIESLVATDDDSQAFHSILETGAITSRATDKYSKNYTYFLEVCNTYATQNPMNWYKLCVTILNRCIVLPIECSSQETALTIFSTLNDRGMPLDDSDIFKAEIYKKIKKERRREFTEQWKELNQTCATSKMNINDIFRYYTHIIRARNGMGAKVKEIGLRRFYAHNKYERLTDKKLIQEIIKLADFWYYLNTRKNPKTYDEGYTISLESRKYIDCLFLYPNEYWKYVVSVYFMKNNEKADFENGFYHALKRITAFMFAKFLVQPTVNAVKPDVFNACVAIENEQDFWNDTKVTIENDNFYSSVKLTRSLLLLHAYLNPKQKKIISYDFHVEHILPRSWQTANYNGWNYKQAEEWLDSYGNRVVFENKLNIQAGNGYFGRKKEKYIQSTIEDILALARYKKDDFAIDDIKKREDEFISRIMRFFAEQGVCKNFHNQ